MKYIITEYRLNNIIFKFLDSKKLIPLKIDEDIIFIKNKSDKTGYLRYDTNDGWLFILRSLNNEVSDFFSLTETESEKIIAEWVEHTLGMRVSETDVWASSTAFVYPRKSD